MAAAFSSCVYSCATHSSIPKLSQLSSQRHFKTSYPFSFGVPKNRSCLRVLSTLQKSKLSDITSQESWNPMILKIEKLVLVKFYTSWCEPCQRVQEVIDEIIIDYAEKLKCVAVNVEQELQVAEEYGIKAVPVVMLFKNGEKCESVIGTMPKEFFVATIERVLGLFEVEMSSDAFQLLGMSEMGMIPSVFASRHPLVVTN
ncbi:thioredoxin M3, chloroplastic-like [Rutidosis leptorrhynchoides]|uniref:thioredoxin M3, chloroplastic-like n=1 Tax=Rutidosis leptorrhynchoides TaxID=125765 RepID=UPI003A99CEB6